MGIEEKINKFYLKTISGEKGIFFSFFRGILFFFSCFYFLIISIRKILYKFHFFPSKKVPLKIVSVGNIVAGGTGKTPLTINLARYFKEKKKNPGVLIRGYKGGDEYFLLESCLEKIPVLKGKNRVKNALILKNKFGCDIAILDDGFQYLKLKKDLNIITLNCLSPFDNGYFIPRGLLRDTVSSLKQADIIVLTNTDFVLEEKKNKLKEFLNKKFPQVITVESIYQPSKLKEIFSGKEIPLEFLRNKEVTMLAGIGNPVSFEKTLEKLGAKIVKKYCFPDHYKYKNEDILKIGKGLVITTAKDAVRLPSNLRFLVLEVNLEIREGKQLWEKSLNHFLIS